MFQTLLYVLGGAVAGAYVTNAVEATRQKKISSDLARQQAFDLSAKELEQGRSYAVMMMVDPADKSFGGIRDMNQAATLIRATLEAPGGTGGWRFSSNASPIDEGNRQLFAAGKPSQWAFTGQWTRPQKFVAEKPGWLTMAVPFLLPVG